MLPDRKRKNNVLATYCLLSWKMSRFAGSMQDQTQESISSIDLCTGGEWYIAQLLQPFAEDFQSEPVSPLFKFTVSWAFPTAN